MKNILLLVSSLISVIAFAGSGHVNLVTTMDKAFDEFSKTELELQRLNEMVNSDETTLTKEESDQLLQQIKQLSDTAKKINQRLEKQAVK